MKTYKFWKVKNGMNFHSKHEISSKFNHFLNFLDAFQKMKFASSKDAMKSAVDGVHQVQEKNDFSKKIFKFCIFNFFSSNFNEFRSFSIIFHILGLPSERFQWFADLHQGQGKRAPREPKRLLGLWQVFVKKVQKSSREVEILPISIQNHVFQVSFSQILMFFSFSPKWSKTVFLNHFKNERILKKMFEKFKNMKMIKFWSILKWISCSESYISCFSLQVLRWILRRIRMISARHELRPCYKPICLFPPLNICSSTPTFT